MHDPGASKPAPRPPFFALLHNRRGERHLNETGDLERAALAYGRATRLAPEWSVPWYNLGLVRKYQRQWAESLRCNLRATELDPEDEAAWWNAGIAATALGDWEVARLAWEAVGIKLPPGEGEIRMRLGLTPIRLNPDGQGEVVWCERIDPARAIIRNVPLPESGHRYGDLQLHDGAPNGTRVYQGQEMPVFDALQLLQASLYTTYQVRVRVGDEEDVLARNDAGLVSIAVEGKVDEPFGPTLGEWLADASAGKRARLAGLGTLLSLATEPPPGTRYQLLHRTASALIEAQRFHASAAVLLVHSFSPSGMWYADYAAFAALLGVDSAPGAVVDTSERGGVRLFLGWVRGDQRFLEA